MGRAPRSMGFAGRPHLRWLPLVVSLAGLSLGIPPRKAEAQPALRGAVIPPPAVQREAAPAPLRWESGPSQRFLCRPGLVWRMTSETAVVGWGVSEKSRRPILQIRLRLEDEAQAGAAPLAWLQHVGNTEVALLKPGDPRLTDIGIALDDSLRPWPNTCTVSVLHLDRALNLNGNDWMELPVRVMSTIPDAEGSGLVLIEADSAGLPRIVAGSEFVGTIRADGLRLTDLRWAAADLTPTLDAVFLPLENCRFLAHLGVQGGADCADCCRLPIVLKADAGGTYHPVYERESQRGLLKRLGNDIEQVQSEAREPLSGEEEAALARIGAFFFLTGTGRETRQQLIRALGPRAEQARAQILLRRLDEYFLLDPS